MREGRDGNKSLSDGFVFRGFENDRGNIYLDGVAEIGDRGILKLTNDSRRSVGHAFYSSPIRFKASPDGAVYSFSTAFAFAIVTEDRENGGSGFAFAVSPTKELPGALPAQFLGLFNRTTEGVPSDHLFAVEFDPVQNLEFNDPRDDHVGIDVNSLTSIASEKAGYFENSAKRDLNLQIGRTIQAWIDYNSTTTEFNITLSLSSTKPSSSILSRRINLTSIFKETMFVGFSASTGQLTSCHYIQGWSFKVNGEASSLDLSSLPPVPQQKRNQVALIISIPLSAIIAFIFAIILALYVIVKMNNKDVIEAWELEIGPHRFSYAELKKATGGFRDNDLIGFGGFGKVYRGTLPNSNTIVAVKRILKDSKLGFHTFVSEVATIGRLRHRNLVQLIGWCRHHCDFLLVYDFMPNGSLDKYIYDEHRRILSWGERFRIIKGVASGLLYLHEGWEQTVIHRDIKAGNVLLDGDMNARLGDFGLAKMYSHGSNPCTTRVVGTLGYLAPELTRTGKPTTSSDVFAFGALILEVVCGRRPVEPKAEPEELILVDWAWEKWKEGSVLDVVDRKLGGEYDELEVVTVVKLGLICSNSSPKNRPSMRQVVRCLEGEMELPEGVPPPDEGDWKRGGGGGGELEDFVHSYPSSSSGIEKASACSVSVGEEGEVDIEAGPTGLVSEILLCARTDGR
ncbi:Non-specific serine/threonine protein kinase [Bertholletia excelsa]